MLGIGAKEDTLVKRAKYTIDKGWLMLFKNFVIIIIIALVTVITIALVTVITIS